MKNTLQEIEEQIKNLEYIIKEASECFTHIDYSRYPVFRNMSIIVTEDTVSLDPLICILKVEIKEKQ